MTRKPSYAGTFSTPPHAKLTYVLSSGTFQRLPRYEAFVNISVVTRKTDFFRDKLVFVLQSIRDILDSTVTKKPRDKLALCFIIRDISET